MFTVFSLTVIDVYTLVYTFLQNKTLEVLSYHFLLLHAIYSTISGQSIWNTPNLFENCHLNFLYWPNSTTPSYPHSSYLYEILRHNPYSPRVLHQFEVNTTSHSTLGVTVSPLGWHAASRQISVSFIHVQFSAIYITMDGHSVFKYLQAIALQYFNTIFFSIRLARRTG